MRASGTTVGGLPLDRLTSNENWDQQAPAEAFPVAA